MPTTYLCSYTTDAGAARNLLLDLDRATAGAFTPGSGALGAPIPLHGKFIRPRGVFGATGGSPVRRTFLPCATITKMNDLFAAGTFTVGTAVFSVTGKRGEHDTIGKVLP